MTRGKFRRLTDPERRLVVDKVLSGQPQHKVAEEFGISQSTVSNWTVRLTDPSQRVQRTRAEMAAAGEVLRDTPPYSRATGETRTPREWAELRGIALKVLMDRLRRGVNLDTALATPVVPVNIPALITSASGERRTIREWSAMTGLSRNRIWKRWAAGLPPDEILKTE